MFNKTLLYTALYSALFMTASLKFMHLFSFINWSPIGWFEKWQVLPSAHYSIKWLFFIITLTICIGIAYIIVSFLDAIPPAVISIILSVVLVVGIEWLIAKPETFMDMVHALSIPFLSITAIVLRFVTGTAVYMRKLSRNEENELL